MHRQAGANCTDEKLYFLDDFPIYFFIQMGPGPTHPTLFFGRFSNFFFIQMGPGPTHPLPIFLGFFECF